MKVKVKPLKWEEKQGETYTAATFWGKIYITYDPDYKIYRLNINEDEFPLLEEAKTEAERHHQNLVKNAIDTLAQFIEEEGEE